MIIFFLTFLVITTEFRYFSLRIPKHCVDSIIVNYIFAIKPFQGSRFKVLYYLSHTQSYRV